ncbi:2,5-diketo-D-gluconate reductase B [Halopelagius inordinatus]|uniref:2,5-diketo-D-gluconate reductase B n=1 Tax=Halopelagius inordinatus TaxID=553467 RepID=A0A1I2VQ95_9EURY|nr:aldo/keto reductase [Halopelagius inordinatus]SFG90477.1 2,5-diketo-D-gluconate reductase B [Halopelagius inordinatus]
MVATLPPIGIGTWQNSDPEQCADSVRTALELGYRHVDTAEHYGNEQSVGEGIERAAVPREEVFLATKIHPVTGGLTYDEVIEEADASMNRLGVEYLDLLYVHWPVGDYEATATLRAFDDLVDDGLVRNVGVSNFDIDLLDEARRTLETPLFAHQVELHPFLPQPELIDDAQRRDYNLVAYSPLARGEALDHPTIRDIADRHGTSPARVCLSWVTSHDNVVAIPKATSRRHLEDNLASNELELDENDIASIDAIEQRKRFVERDGAPWQ